MTQPSLSRIDASRAARWLGAGVLLASFALGLLLLVTIPPVHLYAVVAGLAILTACGLTLLAHGLTNWASAVALIAGGAALVGAGLTVRASSDESPGLSLTLEADPRRCVVSVAGDLPPSLYRPLRDVLDAAPQTRAVLLRSAGGSALAIERVAQLLHERGVDMAAMHGQCDSACAFLWVSAPRRFVVGSERSLAPGFHAPHVRAPGFGLVRASLQDGSQRRYLARAGLPEAFIDWAYAPLDQAWRPDVGQLNRLGVAASFVEADRVEDLSFCGASPQSTRPKRTQRRPS